MFLLVLSTDMLVFSQLEREKIVFFSLHDNILGEIQACDHCHQRISGKLVLSR